MHDEIVFLISIRLKKQIIVKFLQFKNYDENQFLDYIYGIERITRKMKYFPKILKVLDDVVLYF